MNESTESDIFYNCPNNCKDTWFFQKGTITAIRQMTEEGKRMEDDYYDFTPASPVCCYKCREEALVGTKTVRTIITVTVK